MKRTATDFLSNLLSKADQRRSAIMGFINDESGQDIIEYALIAAMVGLGTVSAMSSLASNIGVMFNGVGSTLASAI